MSRRVLSLFSGCGGLDLGIEGNFEVNARSINRSIHPDWIAEESKPGWVKLTGTKFKTVFANDISKAAKAAWLPYFQKRGTNPAVFHLESIVNLVKSSENGRSDTFPRSIDIITGGFPCQDFSVAGKRKGFLSHKNHAGSRIMDINEPTVENRGMLYFWMRRVIELVRPKMFIAENVKGLTNLAEAKSIIENDFRKMSDGGYLVVEAKVLNSANYGVPQNRQRVLFLGFLKSALKLSSLHALSLNRIPPEFDPYPVKTHGIGKANDEHDLMPFVTVGDVIGDLPEPDLTIADESQAAYSKARWYGSHCQGQTEVNLNELGPTIRAEHHGNIEFRRLSKENGGMNVKELEAGLRERRLTVRECARLQTFPDDYEFVRSAENNELKLSASDGYRLIGNAVPPLLTYNIAHRLEELWDHLFQREG